MHHFLLHKSNIVRSVGFVVLDAVILMKCENKNTKVKLDILTDN
jgi:hypothetical protein